MIDASSPKLTRRAQPPPAERMGVALSALAKALGTRVFSGLSVLASRRLSFACNGFAVLMRLAEDTPDLGMSLRTRACFLVSALFTLRANPGALAHGDESWLVAEVEADFGEALALFQTRTGQPRSAPPARPPLPWPTLACV